VAYCLREDNVPAMLVALQANGDLVQHWLIALLEKTTIRSISTTTRPGGGAE